MLNFNREKNNVPKYLKKPEKKPARNTNAAALAKAKKKIYWQAGLAMITIVLTVVIAFAITSAWYTNIVQTSGLVFEAEAWGFEGNIKVNNDPIVAGPGDDGVIHLEVENDSESLIAVGVNISKARMAAEMQQRLYFYVDTQQTRNDETMDRVYLNNQEGYNYTLFSNGKLTLTEEMHNGAQLKWQWVYDVLGYYVYGTEVKDPDGNTTVNIAEYLRPIEYNYDEATTTFSTDENGVPGMALETVDGKTSVEKFLVNFSETDGYKGTIDTTKKLKTGFYPVAVKKDADDNRYGVYAYLCNYAEIQMNNQFDTELGKAAASGENTQTYEAQLTISAQKNKNNVVNATSLAAVYAAIEMGEVDVIQLVSDITVPSEESLTIAKGQRVMLDLNGHTITSENTKNAIKVAEGGALTMINGTVDGTEAGTSNGIYAVGAEVMLSDVEIVGCNVGLRVTDDNGTEARDSKVHLLNCEIESNSYGIVVKGNGSDSEHLTQVIVEGCTITTDSVGISGNGSSDQGGTDIQIINSIITGNKQDKDKNDLITTGIYHPQTDGKLTIYNSEITAYTGLAIKGGSVSVVGSKINGVGEKKEPAFGNSGCADTGDGIYIEANYSGDILLEISGGSKITSEKSYSLQVLEDETPNVIIRIYNGEFDEPQPDAYLAEGSVQNGSTIKEKS